MSKFTLKMGDRFPAGTSVRAYPEANWSPHLAPPEGKPEGKAKGQAAKVGKDSTVDLSGLDPSTTYFAHGEVDGQHRYVRFTTKAD